VGDDGKGWRSGGSVGWAVQLGAGGGGKQANATRLEACWVTAIASRFEGHEGGREDGADLQALGQGAMHARVPRE